MAFFIRKNIVFDLDDTLFLEKDFVFSGFRAVASWLEENKMLGYSKFYNACVSLYDEGKRSNIFNHVLNEHNFSYGASFISELVNIYRSHFPEVSLFPEAKMILQKLHGEYNLAIITDGYLNTQVNKVKALGVEKYFDFVVYSDLGGRDAWKPSPWSYLQVMNHYGCVGKECVYIGDNIAKDFITAKKLNWKTIYVKRADGVYSDFPTSEEYEAHHKIDSLLHLERCLS